MTMQYLLVIGVFFVSIVLHEAGHYLFARRLGYSVDVFSIGVGKKIAAYHTAETEWRLSLLPIGAYVRFSDDEKLRSDPQRNMFFIALAGPLMNYLVAILSLNVLAMTGDRQFEGSDGLKTLQSTIVLPFEAAGDVFFNLPKAALSTNDEERFSSPVGIVDQGAEIVASNDRSDGLLAFAAGLNIGLFLTNLLPLPILDGGRMLIALGNGTVSTVRNKKSRLPKGVEMGLNGLSVLLLLAVFVKSFILDIF